MSRPIDVPLRWRPRAGLLALLSAAVAVAIGASSASAVIVHLHGGKALSYQPLRGHAPRSSALRPFDAFFTNLDYNGGPVMPSNTNYTVYWRPTTGAEAYPSDYQPGLNRYFADLAHDSKGHENVDSVAAQYNDAAGQFAEYESHFGGALVDTHAYPTNGCTRAAICLTDAQIQTELVRFVKEQKLPTDLEHEYFLLTPPHVESCFDPAGFECSAGVAEEFAVYCAYHGNIHLPAGQLIYANDPYVTGNLGCDDGEHPNGTSDGALQGGLSHEHNESITDPEPNNAWTDFVTGRTTGYEIGDKCGGEPGTPIGFAPDGSVYNQVINGDKYWYQEEWSNQKHTCLQRLTFEGERPTARFTSSPVGGNEIAFNAARSTAPGGVARYSWQFNDGGEPSEPAETTTPTVTHNFSSTGSQTVALTVFASNGASIGTARTFEVGDEAPTASFSASGTSVTAGTEVSFNASASNDGDGSITEYEWNFGDGTSATGATATHTYATAGTFGATLTVTDSANLSASSTQPISVGVRPVAPPPVATPAATIASVPALAPAPPLTGAVALTNTSLTVLSRGQMAVKLTCTGTAALCSGELVLTVKQKYRSHGHTRTRTVKIGTIRFSIPAAKTTTVTLKLGSTGLSILRQAGGHLGATLTIHKASPLPALTQAKTVRLVLRRTH
jgi:PKD repeat protein